MKPRLLVAVGFTILGLATVLPPVLKAGYTIDEFDFTAGIIALCLGALFFVLAFTKKST